MTEQSTREVLERSIGPVWMIHEGKRMAMARMIRTVTDIRETPFGPVNFGHVHWGPHFYIVRPDPASRPKRAWWERAADALAAAIRSASRG